MTETRTIRRDQRPGAPGARWTSRVQTSDENNPYDLGAFERVWDEPVRPAKPSGPRAEYRMDYRDLRGAVSTRNISNLQFRDEFGILYLTAFCHRADDNRSFRVNRILSMTPLSGPLRHVDPRQLARRALGLDIPERIREEFESTLEIVALVGRGRAGAEVSLPPFTLPPVVRHVLSQSNCFDEVAPHRMETHLARLRVKSCTIEAAAARIVRQPLGRKRELIALIEHVLDLMPEKKRKQGEQVLAMQEELEARTEPPKPEMSS